MYLVEKTIEVAGAHRLCLGYDSPCGRFHGHNWIIKVTCRSKKLNADGMVADFGHIGSSIKNTLDHQNLNDLVPQPTAEHLAKFIAGIVGPTCVSVQVQESAGNIATWNIDE